MLESFGDPELELLDEVAHLVRVDLGERGRGIRLVSSVAPGIRRFSAVPVGRSW
jgi:hypothetical protein